MASLWKCKQGHETDAADAPAFCPVCGDSDVARAAAAGVLATVDLATSSLDLAAPLLRVSIVEPLGSNGEAAHVRVEVPGYEVLGELGRGGMGVVYKARQRGLNRTVALKMILAAEHAGPNERARFQVEAEAVARLQHPNIVQIYDVGEADGRPYFSLEFVDGGSLAQKLAGKPQPARAAATLVETLARAVAAAHGVGIVHRDLKPANVLLASINGEGSSIKSLDSVALQARHPFGVPKITDFGLAKKLEGGSGQTQSGSVLGTPAYMAPEQAAGRIKEIAAHTDVYALGAILYELLTGRAPFGAETPFDTIMQVLRDEPAPPRSLQPKVPRDLEIICLKCLEKKPEKRYPGAEALAEDLRRFLEGEPISARPATRPERLRKWVRRHPAGSGFIALGAVALATVFALGWVYHGRVRDALDAANRERDKLAEEKKDGLRRNIHLMVANGTKDVNNGDFLWGVLWFTEALRLEEDPARQEMHRVRIAAVLRQSPRLGRAWFHEGRVADACFSPDGARVATACADGRARVFAVNDPCGCTPRLELEHPAAVLAVRFSPTGEFLVTTCADDAARVWNAKTGKRQCEPLRHAGAVNGVDFSPDGLRVLTASADRTARIWDTLTGEASAVVFKHSGAVTQAEFAPDGERVVTAGADGAARVWDAETGRPVAPVLAHAGPVVRARFSPDGTRVLTASRDQTARVWDAATGEPVTPLIRRSTPLTDAEFSPSGRDVVTASTDGTGRVWNLDINDWRTHVIRHDSPIEDIAFSPDGRALGTGGADNTARVWDVASGAPLTPPLRHNGAVYRVTFSADGAALLTASQDGLVRLWDVVAGRAPAATSAYGSRHAGHSYDRRRRLRIDGDTVHVLDAGTGAGAGLALRHRGRVYAASFSPDGTRVLTAAADRTARVWDAATGAPVGEPLRHGSDVTCAAFGPDGKLIATGSDDNTARVWDAATGAARTPPLRHSASVEKAVFSPDGRCLLTYAEDGLARVWDAATGEALAPPQKPAGWVAKLLAAGAGDAAGWDLPPDPRGAERLALLAQWHSAHRIDAGGSLVPLDLDGMRAVWERLQADHPAEFALAGDRAAWHRQGADAAEAGRDWFAAVFHLGRLLDAGNSDGPATARLRARRGRAYAEQGLWAQAGSDFAAAAAAGLDDEGLLTDLALARLGAGDTKGYRDACRQLLDLSAESANGESACRMAWTCLLAPGGAEDVAALDGLTRRGGKKETAGVGLLVRGAALARAGKWDEAAAVLLDGQALAEGADAPRAWLLLALAERRLGRADAARRWLKQTDAWLTRYDTPRTLAADRGPSLPWQQRLELRLLRDEADRATAEKGDAARIEKIE
jgi:WD40 repeat protein/predicted Ser/Thr protein kinase